MAQIKAAITVNRELLNTYWDLGKEITAKQQQANWGEALIDQLAKDLSAALPGVKGFSSRNLFYIRKWYLFYNTGSIVPQPVALLPSDSAKTGEIGKIQQLGKGNRQPV